MDARVTWNGRMSFTGSAETGFELPIDSDPSVGGDDSGFRPMELIAIGLAGCTALDVISILKKKRQDVREFSVEVSTDRAEEHPKVFTKARILYRVTGKDIDEAAVARAVELSETKYCPAQAMLNEVMPIDHSWEIVPIEE
ncbi:MAG: OsmC family protein [Anaerolineales bacterium]|jgi:putative redox protein